MTGDVHWQQEVTAGVDGRLSGISLWGSGVAHVRIAEGDGFTTGPFVFSQVVDFGSSTTRLFIDTFAAGIILSAGDTFVIDLPGSTGAWVGTGTPYAGGDLWVSHPAYFPTPVNYTAQHGLAMQFETYMGGVPEPGAWALMILGFGLAGAGLRRTRSVGPALA